MKEIIFRTLRADEIEVRPATIKDGKATMLLYIDSRATVRIMNETVGAMNWTMDFTEVNGQVVGKLGIWDEDKGQFIYKCDTGSESNIEAAKGLFSDCYKRCLARWGVTELYTAPKIIVDDNGYGCSGYKVGAIEYNDNREITHLEITDRFGNVTYTFPANSAEKKKPQQKTEEKQETDEERRIRQLQEWFKEAQRKPNINKTELVKFKDHYKEKAATFKYRNYDCEKLWGIWQKNAL